MSHEVVTTLSCSLLPEFDPCFVVHSMSNLSHSLYLCRGTGLNFSFLIGVYRITRLRSSWGSSLLMRLGLRDVWFIGCPVWRTKCPRRQRWFRLRGAKDLSLALVKFPIFLYESKIFSGCSCEELNVVALLFGVRAGVIVYVCEL